MEELEITSHQNPRVKSLIGLRKKRERDKSHEFLIEGYREILRSQNSHCEISEIYFCQELFLGENEEALIQDCCKKGAKAIAVSKGVFEKISYRDRPDGLLARAKQWDSSLSQVEKVLKKDGAFVLVAVSIEKPGNLGTILRSADACGADAVIICDECTDIFNPNVVRASTGTLFTQTVLECSSIDFIRLAKQYKVQLVAATPSGDLNYTQVDFKQSSAIILGCEQYGLSKDWLSSSNHRVVIPMKGQADSLNVAMAATILSYEALRQKSL